MEDMRMNAIAVRDPRLVRHDLTGASRRARGAGRRTVPARFQRRAAIGL
jgi:hypothetical protein